MPYEKNYSESTMRARLERVYLDTNIFIFGRKSDTNCSKLLNLASIGAFIPVISYWVIEEVTNWFKINEGREAAFKIRCAIDLLPNIEFVSSDVIKPLMLKYKRKVPDDDLPHFCAAKLANVDYFISTNRHFLKEQTDLNAVTPREFLVKIGFRDLCDTER